MEPKKTLEILIFYFYFYFYSIEFQKEFYILILHGSFFGFIIISFAFILDDTIGSSANSSPSFVMSGANDFNDDITIPVVFLYNQEGSQLLEQISRYPNLLIRISNHLTNPRFLFEKFLVKQDYSLIFPLLPPGPI